MNRTMAEALLLDLGRRMGIPALRMGDRGCCQLVFDGRWLVTVSLHPSGDRLALHCPISPPDSASRFDPQTLLALLEGSFMGCAAFGGTLAVTPDQRACVQHELRLAGAGVEVLEAAIEHLLAAAEAWAVRLAQGPGSPAPLSRPAADLLVGRA